ncbi:MAG: nucleotide exchange factor GrpE, partial [Rhizobiales bacterium]|nr:nucleotide exchange factor GrpE [Hyphomicrobiales bacterium]
MTDRPAADDMAAKPEGALPEGEATAAAAPAMVPAAQVTAALEAAAEFKDKLLRTLAEMENLRKRTEREINDARVYGIAGFARDVLAVADNMHRALGTIEAELREHADAKMKALIEGVELTERELMKVLEKYGVTKFSPAGEKFDPNVHQAMYEVPESDLPPGHV